MRFIGLLDCNNFFVSCERLFRPDLRTRPTMVLSSNDGCAVARSQEIKDMGIPMGVPYFQVKDILKDSNPAVFSSNFKLYRDISHRVFSILGELVVTEQYSVDEAFFILDEPNVESAEARAMRIKRQIELQTGIPVSIGLAASKTQAKYASRSAKRGSGVCVLTNEDFQKRTLEIPLGEVWGIGGRLLERCKAQEMFTVYDLVSADQARIAKLFGIGGVRLQQELAGQYVFVVTKKRDVQKSIMHTRSFRHDTTVLSVVEDAVAYHVRQALEDLRGMGQQAQTLRVMIRPSRHGDWMFRGGTKEVLLPTPSSDTRVFMREAMKLTNELFEVGVPYRKAGIVLGMFTPKNVTQQGLFESTKKDTAQLMETIDILNARFGNDVVQLGTRLRQNEWSVRRERLSPAYTTNWSDIPSVTAKT